MTAGPPPRIAHHFENEQFGWPVDDCAKALIDTLSAFVRDGVDFSGDANGRVWSEEEKDGAQTRLRFTSDLGDGEIALSADIDGWVRADVRAGVVEFCVWMESAYEEKEFWPSGSNGFGEAPGRISKRGSWLQIDRARFDGGVGYWSVEAAQ